MNCYYESYDDKIKRNKIIKKGSYLLKSSCCNQDCNNLIHDIENTANECHNLFSHMHIDNLNEEGKIISGSLCSDLDEKKARILSEITSNSKGGKRKRKRKSKRTRKSKLTKHPNRRIHKQRISRRVKK